MKAHGWSLSICCLSLCAGAATLALTLPQAATAAITRPASATAYPAVPDRLYSVAAISANDVWAVGLYPTGWLALNWNGSTWAQYEASPGYFNGVGASSASDVWAVGGTNWFSPSQTLAMHWNGKTLTRVPTPNPPGGGEFSDVAATSPDNAWAVGLAGPGPGIPSPTTPLIEHWNGNAWTIQKYQVPAAGGQFTGVAAISPDNVWVVGYTGAASEGTGQQTLIEHWNGDTWTRVPSPNVAGASANLLQSLTVVSADNAWAVGQAVVGGLPKTLALYWNGVQWTISPSLTPGGNAAFLGVTHSWTNNIWAVGITNPSGCAPSCQTLVEHWNSIHQRWSVIPSPNAPNSGLNVLWGISAVSRSDIWAVGSTDYASTLIEHWNGTSWS